MNMNERDYCAGLSKVAPVACDFNVGDLVTFTNQAGIAFYNLKVVGFAEDDSFNGRFIHLNTSSYWFPCAPSALKKQAVHIEVNDD